MIRTRRFAWPTVLLKLFSFLHILKIVSVSCDLFSKISLLLMKYDWVPPSVKNKPFSKKKKY